MSQIAIYQPACIERHLFHALAIGGSHEQAVFTWHSRYRVGHNRGYLKQWCCPRSVTQGSIVGTWIYVSSTAKRDDGSNVPRPSLQGAVTYTADGRFHFITTRTDAPKYASGDLARPSPEEAMAIASGSIAYTGTYTVDEGTKTIHVSIETSTFPNLVGAPNQRRIVTSITADEMKFTNPRTRGHRATGRRSPKSASRARAPPPATR